MPEAVRDAGAEDGRRSSRCPILDALIATHAPLLAQASEAARDRTFFAAFAESPSTRIWGEAAPADGRAAFDDLLHQPFPIQTPGAARR